MVETKNYLLDNHTKIIGFVHVVAGVFGLHKSFLF